jgi:hypothetical protein
LPGENELILWDNSAGTFVPEGFSVGILLTAILFESDAAAYLHYTFQFVTKFMKFSTLSVSSNE